MSKRQNLLAVWQQIPVANRTVEVNTKTGFSLTAGSYSVRASSAQTGTVTIINTATTGTAAITSVTTTRAYLIYGGFQTDTDNVTDATRIILTNATTVTATRYTSGGASVVDFNVQELF